MNLLVLLISPTMLVHGFPISHRVHTKYNIRKATTPSGVSYGNYNESVYNALRNEYFWRDNAYVVPIDKQKAKNIAWFWNHGQFNKNRIYEKRYHHYRIDMNHPKVKCYKWIPLSNKDNVCALINCSVDNTHKTIKIVSILLRPYHDEKEKKELMSDLHQLTLFQYDNEL